MNRSSHSIRRLEKNDHEEGDGVQELRSARQKLQETLRKGISREEFEDSLLQLLGWGLVSGQNMSEEIACGKEIQRILDAREERALKTKRTSDVPAAMTNRFKVS